MTNRPTRRTVLLSTGAAALLAGCGDGDNGSAPTDRATESDGGELTTTDAIPVGGGTIFEDEKVVVTQPEEGEFRAFSGICTHQQCLVANVSGGTINCTCHGSKYSITDGSVVNPPAPLPLPEREITVEGNSIRLA